MPASFALSCAITPTGKPSVSDGNRHHRFLSGKGRSGRTARPCGIWRRTRRPVGERIGLGHDSPRAPMRRSRDLGTPVPAGGSEAAATKRTGPDQWQRFPETASRQRHGPAAPVLRMPRHGHRRATPERAAISGEPWRAATRLSSSAETTGETTVNCANSPDIFRSPSIVGKPFDGQSRPYPWWFDRGQFARGSRSTIA